MTVVKKQTTDLSKAEVLMKELAQLTANKKELNASIANALKAYNDGIKEKEAELLAIAERNREKFNAEGNLVFEHGYVHVANNTVVVTTKKFDAVQFEKAHPDMIDLSKALKIAPIKKAYLDATLRKELKSFGVDVTTEEQLQVIPL